MRVRLLVDISGTRDGQPWPGRGNIMELPEDEARDMIKAEQVVPADGPVVAGPPAVERAVMPDDIERRDAVPAVEPQAARERPLTTSTGPAPPRKGSTR